MASFFDNRARAAGAAASSSSKLKQPVVIAERAQPWVEKYRLVLDKSRDGIVRRGLWTDMPEQTEGSE